MTEKNEMIHTLILLNCIYILRDRLGLYVCGTLIFIDTMGPLIFDCFDKRSIKAYNNNNNISIIKRVCTHIFYT